MNRRPAGGARIVVLGVGNLLASDEGVGPHFIARLERRWELPAAVRAIDGGTSAMDLLDDLSHLDLLLIVDAVAGDARPGTVHVLEGDRIPEFFTLKLSPHQVGLSDVLATLRWNGESPREIVIVGVEPASFDLSMDLSPAVEEALSTVEGLVLARLERAGCPLARRGLAEPA